MGCDTKNAPLLTPLESILCIRCSRRVAFLPPLAWKTPPIREFQVRVCVIPSPGLESARTLVNSKHVSLGQRCPSQSHPRVVTRDRRLEMAPPRCLVRCLIRAGGGMKGCGIVRVLQVMWEACLARWLSRCVEAICCFLFRWCRGQIFFFMFRFRKLMTHVHLHVGQFWSVLFTDLHTN